MVGKANDIDERFFIFQKQAPIVFDFGMLWSHLVAIRHTCSGNRDPSNGLGILVSNKHISSRFKLFQMFFIPQLHKSENRSIRQSVFCLIW